MTAGISKGGNAKIVMIEPASAKVLSKLLSSGSLGAFDTHRVTSYNFDVLGNSLVVGQRTLNPLG